MENYKPAMVDIIMGILGLTEVKENESWPTLKVYEAFYNMCKKERELSCGLYFSVRGDYHYSKELEEIFFQLGTARLLEVRNPAYSCFLLAEQSKNRIKDYLSRVLSEEDLEKVSNLSKDFRDQIKGVLTTEDVSVCNF